MNGEYIRIISFKKYFLRYAMIWDTKEEEALTGCDETVKS